jgi:beta-phosphoglucomutase family hydrolase
MPLPEILILNRFDAVLFDLDGVLTPTAKVHAKCWKRMFDEFRDHRLRHQHSAFEPFEIAADYRPYVDGKPRYEGVHSFLRARGIELPFGDPLDPAGFDTICSLGNRKDELVHEVLASEVIDPFPGARALVEKVREAGLKTAVVSSSKNARAVLEAAGISALFDLCVDGVVAEQLGLRGKPAPDTFLEAAKELGVAPERAVVVEDAIVGVQAGRAGQFGLVIGIARHGDRDELEREGADRVITGLSDLL